MGTIVRGSGGMKTTRAVLVLGVAVGIAALGALGWTLLKAIFSVKAISVSVDGFGAKAFQPRIARLVERLVLCDVPVQKIITAIQEKVPFCAAAEFRMNRLGRGHMAVRLHRPLLMLTEEIILFPRAQLVARTSFSDDEISKIPKIQLSFNPKDRVARIEEFWKKFPEVLKENYLVEYGCDTKIVLRAVDDLSLRVVITYKTELDEVFLEALHKVRDVLKYRRARNKVRANGEWNVDMRYRGYVAVSFIPRGGHESSRFI